MTEQNQNCEHGLCGGCKWWQSDVASELAQHMVGLCQQPEIVRFQLQVSDDSGCNRFEPAHAMAAGFGKAGGI